MSSYFDILLTYSVCERPVNLCKDFKLELRNITEQYETTSWGRLLNRTNSVFCSKICQKKSISLTRLYHQVVMTFYIPAVCRAKYFPGFPAKFWGFFYLSSLHVCGQCFPLQIKYVSFADEVNSLIQAAKIVAVKQKEHGIYCIVWFYCSSMIIQYTVA